MDPTDFKMTTPKSYQQSVDERTEKNKAYMRKLY